MSILRVLEEGGEDQISYLIIGLSTFLVVTIMISSYFKKHNITPYHPVAIMIISIACSIFLKLFYGLSPTAVIPQDLIFKVLAPPIIFAAGFNLKEKYFFKNIGFIGLFGIVGTMVSFVLMSTGIFFTNRLLQPYIGANPSDYSWTLINVLRMCAPLINTNSWYAEQFLREGEDHPALYSIIFGEGVLNDAAGLILVDTVINLAKGKHVLAGTAMVGEFFEVFGRSSVLSILCGLAFGGLGCLIFKYFTFLKVSGINEIYLITALGMIMHTFAELEVIALPGVVVLFIYGIVQSHYNRHNLSEEAVEKASFVFELMGWICETMTFLYMGLSFGNAELVATPTLIFAAVDLLILFAARITTMFLLAILANKLSKKKQEVCFRETSIFATAGLPRGAISYALALHISDGQGQFIQNMVPICQVMIVGSSLLFVPVMHFVFNLFLGRTSEDQDEHKRKEIENEEKDRKHKEELIAAVQNSDIPLMRMTKSCLLKQKEVGFSLALKQLDELALKPVLIRDYRLRIKEIEGERHGEIHGESEGLEQKNEHSKPEEEDGERVEGASFHETSFSLPEESLVEPPQDQDD